ncbi:hypothetical protein [Pseudomonas turukhanskensis]|uniref:Uncharacterized protein n=1 Tax=Pseudomonas turukhanskensis TaxID=1806536 RepID=A0A9W6K2I3_9PSED|nr:hypothetical protein [Pseudomonas turukhanskensis]GLK87682.1 hypothetical protein GCM10017655_07440 [Pseudomonas turukhanskensis]
MAKPNYAFAKQQRDLAKEQKKEEKRLRKLAHEQEHGEQAEGESPADAQATDDKPSE